ncbi:acyl-CoA dehydrogenase family protein [Streptomyces sp. NPDC087420]|uniref:acyl-CoA dehydrogenase family protein n=1 Tax=Streptomyces sp. NPDC087420 TaxID=3365785 RepID=UPI003838160A
MRIEVVQADRRPAGGGVFAREHRVILGVAKILRFAAKERQREWLPRSRGRRVPPYDRGHRNSPPAGTSWAWRTTGRRSHRDHVINGRKTFVGNSHAGDLHDAADLLDHGLPCDPELINAKYVGSVVAQESTRTALLLAGAPGLCRALPFGRSRRDAQHMDAPAGTGDIRIAAWRRGPSASPKAPSGRSGSPTSSPGRARARRRRRHERRDSPLRGTGGLLRTLCGCPRG